jgi:TRAP-type C4-dicarboxylate transport system substrate-binding protein
MAPTVIAYNEIYNGIQTGVIQAGDNEAAGVEQMKFYEVGPNLMLTRHAISIRPICFSGKTLRKLPPDLQAAIRKAAAEAGDWERQLESSGDTAILQALEKAGKLKLVKFDDRDKLQQAMAPVLAAYAKEIGADAIYARINAIK